MIIELFGVPGSGKTTLCKNIVKIKGEYCLPMSFFVETFVGRILMHIFWKYYRFNRKLRKIYNIIIEIIGNVDEYSHLYIHNLKIDSYLKYVVFSYYLEAKLTRKNCIMDEGIIHYCMSFYAEFGLEIEKIDKIIETLMDKNVRVCGLINNKEVVLNNIMERNRKVSYIDKMSLDDLSKLLDKYYEVFSIFQQRFECLRYNEILDKFEGGYFV